MTYDWEEDIDNILRRAKDGEIDSGLRTLMTEAWQFGWTSGFAFQETVEGMDWVPTKRAQRQQIRTEPRVVEVQLPEEE